MKVYRLFNFETYILGVTHEHGSHEASGLGIAKSKSKSKPSLKPNRNLNSRLNRRVDFSTLHEHSLHF